MSPYNRALVRRFSPVIPSLLLSAALLRFAPPAQAQTRPRLTEEATTAPAGRMVLEAGANWIASETNFQTGDERDRLDVPVLNFVWSPSDNVEIDVGWVGRVVAFSDPDLGSVSDWGDVTLRAKARVLGGAAERIALALRFGVSLPETNEARGLGPNTLRMSAELLASRPLGRFTLHANAGLALQDKVDRPHEQRDFLAWGAAIDARLGARNALVADLSGWAGASSPGAEQKAEARLGLRHERGRFALDLALRHGLTRSAGRLGMTAGIRWTAKAGDASPRRPSAEPDPAEVASTR